MDRGIRDNRGIGTFFQTLYCEYTIIEDPHNNLRWATFVISLPLLDNTLFRNKRCFMQVNWSDELNEIFLGPYLRDQNF